MLKNKNKKKTETAEQIQPLMFSGVNLPTTEFELLDNIADLLKPVSVTLLFALIVGDHLQWQNQKWKTFPEHTGSRFSTTLWKEGGSHQEGGSLKQKNFIGLYDLCKIPQVCLQLLDIWDELVHYARPCLQRDF